MFTLSCTQLVMAALAIITNLIGLSTKYPREQYAGTGIWCGILFGLSGIFGTVASFKRSPATIITFMVFAIIAAVFSFPLLFVSLMTRLSKEPYTPNLFSTI